MNNVVIPNADETKQSDDSMLADTNPRLVTNFESRLLLITSELFKPNLSIFVSKWIVEKQPKPQTLSPNAMHVLKNILSKGCILHLAKKGGWKNEAYIRELNVVEGQVWQRSSADDRQLQFSSATIEFLLWLTCESATKPSETFRSKKRTVADELFFAIIAKPLFLEQDIWKTMQFMPIFAENPLARLLYPHYFLNINETDCNFISYINKQNSYILESLQTVLAQSYIEQEYAKSKMKKAEEMNHLGQLQYSILESYLGEAIKLHRPDLATFLLRALNHLLAGTDREAGFWHDQIEGASSLKINERLNYKRNSLALLRHATTLQKWTKKYQSVGYIDEEYAVSQLWKKLWEQHSGDEIVAKANQILESIEPLKSDGGNANLKPKKNA